MYPSGYADALWDIRHNFTTGFTYELPVGKGRTLGTSEPGAQRQC